MRTWSPVRRLTWSGDFGTRFHVAGQPIGTWVSGRHVFITAAVDTAADGEAERDQVCGGALRRSAAWIACPGHELVKRSAQHGHEFAQPGPVIRARCQAGADYSLKRSGEFTSA